MSKFLHCAFADALLLLTAIGWLSSVRAAGVPLILDTDIGPDYDDVGALAVAHALADRGDVDLRAIVCCNLSERCLPSISIINHHYGRTELPVGEAVKTAPNLTDDSWHRRNWSDMLMSRYSGWKRTEGSQVPSAIEVYRRVLAAAEDRTVVICTVGFFSNLPELLDSSADAVSSLCGRELVARKVARLVSMAGRFPEGREWNVEKDVAAVRRVLAEWPTPILWVDVAVGNQVLTGADLVHACDTSGPVKDVYSLTLADENHLERGHESWDQTTVLAAVEDPGDWFDVERGDILVSEDGRSSWKATPSGRYGRVVLKGCAGDVASRIERLMSAQPRNGRLRLADRGRRTALPVVLDHDASQACRAAVQVYADAVRRMTGVEPAVVDARETLPESAIVIGCRQHEESAGLAPVSGDDAFRLKGVRSRLYVSGNGGGVFYGIAELLERFGGCGWFAADCEVVPVREELSVPDDLDVCEKPAFTSRIHTWHDMTQDVRLSALNRLSLPSCAARFGLSALKFDDKLGRCHTFGKLVPTSEYWDSHPEYFSEIAGRRIRNSTQLCLSNPDVQAIVIRKVLEAAKAGRERGVRCIGVSQDDNRNFCQCGRCREVDAEECSPAGSVIRFVNRVADAVARVYPDVIIETLAYQYSRHPPKMVRPRPNVLVCLCASDCDCSKPFAKSDNRESRAFAEDVRRWGAIATRLMVWDYTVDFNAYPYPFPNLKALKGNLSYFQDNGVTDLYEQGAWNGDRAHLAELRGWLLGKWMWNPRQSGKALLSRFLRAYYGPAASSVATYLSELHALDRDEAVLPLTCYEDIGSPALDDAFLDRAAELWRTADRQCSSVGEPYRRRVAWGGFGVEFTRLMRYLSTPGGALVYASRKQPVFDPVKRQEMRKTAVRLAALLDSDPHARLAEGIGYSRRFEERIRRFAQAELPPKASDRAMIGEWMLAIGNDKRKADYVDDAQAQDGRALWLSDTHHDWTGYFPLSSCVVDPDCRYRVRIRARIKPRPSCDGPAFWCGIYNSRMKKASVQDLEPIVSQTSREYAWYELDEWVPDADDLLWVAPGRFRDGHAAHAGVWIDCCELVREDK